MSTHRLGVAAALVDGHHVPGDVEVANGKVTAVGVGGSVGSGLAVPGLVDLQVNGFAGIDFTDTDLAGYRTASTSLARTGVTSILATLPTMAPDRYADALRVASEATRTVLPGAQVAGIHLEGPFLSATRAGAHRPEWLQAPTTGPTDDLLASGDVVLMTVAPEIDGGLDLIRALRQRGIVVSVGHSDAPTALAHQAFDVGATCITHLWNAHRPITSRDPGVGGVALARPDVFVCVIADLIHVAPETLRFTVEAARGRFALVSDAVAPAGIDEGDHRFGNQTVTLRDGAVRLADGTLAGSACPLDQALRNLVGLGVAVSDAVSAVTTTPARLLGRPDLGHLVVDGPADVTVLDDSLMVRRVLVGGFDVL